VILDFLTFNQNESILLISMLLKSIIDNSVPDDCDNERGRE